MNTALHHLSVLDAQHAVKISMSVIAKRTSAKHPSTTQGLT
jgi:hypothetical protein